MGTYKQVRIDADIDNRSTKKLATIKEILHEYGAFDCWRRWCDQTKWWPDTAVAKLTKALPQVLFRVDMIGQAHGTYYVLGGYEVDENDIFPRPRFPTKKEFDSGKDRKDRRITLQEKEEARQKIARKRKRLSDLKQSRANLDKKIQSMGG